MSRKTFYAIRARAREEGPAAVLEPKSRRPRSSPTRIGEDVKQRALDVRATLEASGWDHGPISVHDKMKSLGLAPVPSIASLARIFREKNVARKEPNKRPRASYRRFVYPEPNGCWQLDATEYVLTYGRKCVIFQLEDDHSRVAVASHVGRSENGDDAMIVMRKGIAARGVPQKLLTDNHTALNPSRRGWIGQLTAFVTTLGVAAITGRPGKPTTQGKNERFHQTLFKFLDEQPIAESIEQLQALVDEFDEYYNNSRGHQGLPGRITPQQAWEATPVAEPPRPPHAPVEPVLPPSRQALRTGEPAPLAPPAVIRRVTPGERVSKVRPSGCLRLLGVEFRLPKGMSGLTVHSVWDTTDIVIAHPNGEVIAEHTWPPQGITYVGNGMPRGRPPKPQPSPKS